MPRPGPRPYECVRRAWHSERHQPMRGSLIQEIFRVVNETHSSATKKNKEWQEKLPLVVLKAEEIMYSKANSEAEYMDLKTLWERTNDAINTIIRRDESSESGELLQPCIEAALNLGCTPRRASRSQRHNNPRCYLSSTTQEATQMSVAPKNSETMQYDGSSRLLPPRFGIPIPNSSPQFSSYYPPLVTPTNVTSTHLGSDSCSPILQDKTMPHEQVNHPPMSSCEFPPLPENFALSWQDKSSLPMDPSPRLGGVYPLYYSTNHQMVESGFAFQYPQGSNGDAIMVSMPHVQPIPEAKMGLLQNLLSGNNALDASNKPANGSLNLEGTSENPPDMGYDLSLRLGPLPTPCLSMENSPTLEDAGSSSRDRSRFCDPSLSRTRTGHFDCSSSSPQRDQRFCFFPGESSRTPWSAAQVNGVPGGKI